MFSINLFPLNFNLLLNFKAYIAFLFLVFLSIIYRFLKLQSSRSSEAEQYFKRAIRLAPLDPSTHHHYGNLSFLLISSLFPSNTHTKWGKSEIFWFDGSLTFVFSFHYSWVSLINLETRRSMRESCQSCRVVTERLSISHWRCNSFADARSEAWGGKMVSSGEQQSQFLVTGLC